MLVAEVDLLSRFFNFLLRKPSAVEILALSTTDEENERFQELSAKEASGQISVQEIQELGCFMKAEHLIRMAKIEAYGQINGQLGE